MHDKSLATGPAEDGEQEHSGPDWGKRSPQGRCVKWLLIQKLTSSLQHQCMSMDCVHSSEKQRLTAMGGKGLRKVPVQLSV